MQTIYEKYMALPIDKGLLCLEPGDITASYFCYPINAEPIGFDGCILYCFLPEYGEMVFACNPESCADQHVYPLAANFEDFIRLILACSTANPVEQIVWMDKSKFEEHMTSEEKILTDDHKTTVQQLQHELGLLPIENPFEYVKAIQKDFDGSEIQYNDEYYEVTGIENPKRTDAPDEPLIEFKPATIEIHNRNDRNILMNNTLYVNDKEYTILKLLGKGKGGYSYLAQMDHEYVVVKQIHHEPCAYYQFGNKIEAEINDYKRLQAIGISMPEMLDVDIANERIVKEYITGDTVYELVLKDELPEICLQQVREMCRLLYPANTNIDYFPTNFILQNGTLYYVDYECNDYMEEWNFENWGIKYWSKTPEFMEYVKEHS